VPSRQQASVDELSQVASLRAVVKQGRGLTIYKDERQQHAVLYPTAAVSTAERFDPFYSTCSNTRKGLMRAYGGAVFGAAHAGA